MTRHTIDSAAKSSVDKADDLQRRFSANGFVGPLDVVSRREMQGIRAHLEVTVLCDQGGVEMRHLNCRVLHDLCCAPTLLDHVERVLGPDLVLWRSRLFIKEPSDQEFPWHHDGAYFSGRLTPLVNVTAWVALDDVDRGNSCVRFIPGSHKSAAAHVRSTGAVSRIFGFTAEQTAIDESAAVYMEMRAGQCVLFDELVLHGSTANTSSRRRAGLSMRFTVPRVKIADQPAPLLVRGRDEYRFNNPASPAFRC